MKNFFITLVLFLAFTSCSVNNSVNNANSGTNLEKFNLGEKNISTENNTNSGNSQTGNLETNKLKQMTKKLQNGDVVAFMTTNKGKIEIFLETKKAPITTANFIGLAKKGYYDGVIFHRVIKDFMIQGGDPKGDGTGGESIYGDKFDDEFSDGLLNNKFTISMANAGTNTNGSQFFINVANNNSLDGKHAVFGEVINGSDNVLSISKIKTGLNDKPEKEVKIISIDIRKYENDKFVDYDFSEEEAVNFYKERKKIEAEAKKIAKIKYGDKVNLEFVLKSEKGEILGDSKVDGRPLIFEVKENTPILSGLMNGLIDMKIGDKKELKLSPKEAYGEYDEKNTQEIPREDLKQLEKSGVKIEVGGMIPTIYGQFKILKVDEKTVTIDANNPLAGQTLIFDIEVKDIN